MNRWMLTIIALPAILVLCAFYGQDSPSPPPQTCQFTDEDYAVYSAVLDNLGRPEDPEEEWRDKRETILADSTIPGENPGGNGWGFRSASKRAPTPQTIRNYNARSANICHLQSRFTAKISPSLISRESLEKNFMKKGDGWSRFYKDHPDAAGYWDFSAVGYSEDHQEALLYLGHHCGPLCGTGHLVLLERENDIWVVKNRLALWIS